MVAERLVVIGLGCAALIGCATLRPEVKIDAACDRVEERVGGGD